MFENITTEFVRSFIKGVGKTTGALCVLGVVGTAYYGYNEYKEYTKYQYQNAGLKNCKINKEKERVLQMDTLENIEEHSESICENVQDELDMGDRIKKILDKLLIENENEDVLEVKVKKILDDILV
jgi:hypothetical protein